MAIVDVKDKTYNQSVSTSFHTYWFGRTERPKVLDLFIINDSPGVRRVYGTELFKEVKGVKVNKGFYNALKDMINRWDNVLVKLTREEEDFFKMAEPEIYEVYLKYHKGGKFPHEIEEEKQKRIAEQQAKESRRGK